MSSEEGSLDAQRGVSHPPESSVPPASTEGEKRGLKMQRGKDRGMNRGDVVRNGELRQRWWKTEEHEGTGGKRGRRGRRDDGEE